MIDEDTEPLYFEPIAGGLANSASDTLETIVRDSLRWVSLSEAISAQPRSTVDFSQMMLLAVVLPAPTGGYDVQFQSVEIAGDTIRAHYAVGTPADDCIPAMGTTTPFAVVSVRADPRPVVFERSQELITCTFR